MLSAFTARPIVELRQRDKSKIESILAFGDRLIVGLNTGSLRIYQVNDTPGDVGLLREVEKFSTRAIEQLARIKEANVLISLSNYYVSIHDLQTYALQEQLTRTKNASTFAVTSNIVKDPATGIPEIISRLAVAVKRRLLIWSWHQSELSSETTEITLAESIRTLTWASATKIICGMNSGYVIVDINSHEIEDIVGPGAIGGATSNQGGRFGGMGSASMGYMGLGGYIPKPLATKLADGEILLAKDINSLFITSEGKPIEKRQIPWQPAPDAIGYSYPYIIILQAPSKGMLEVRNPDTLSLLQTIPLPNANQLHFPPPNISLAHAGKGFHVASERCIWRMGATDYDSQIDELVAKGRYDEALSILNMLEDALLNNKTERVQQVEALKSKLHFDQQIEQAQALFNQRKYRAAIDIFIAIEAPPEHVIKLYPKAIAGDLSVVEEKNGDVETDNDEANGSANSDSDSKDSLKPAAVKKLIRNHQKSSSDASSIRSFVKHDNSDNDNASIKAVPVEDGPLEGKDLITAAKELNAFLVDARTRLKKFLDSETGKIIHPKENGHGEAPEPTFDSLLAAPESEAEAEKDREQKLLETAKLVDTTLFRSYMLSMPSLAGPLFRLPNFCDPDVVNEKLLETGRYNDLVDFFHGKKLHRPALELLKKFGMGEEENEQAPTLHGPQRTVGYLQHLPPEMIDLILEFAEWPLRADPDLGMEIFLADTENAETLPREKVLNFLHNIDINLEVRYLEHVINELNDMTADFHNRLVGAYMQELKQRLDRDSEQWKDLMGRMVSFLRSSNIYSCGRAFGLIDREDPNFYEAQAVVLSNMGSHKQALEIYVFKIKDFEKAEEYCNRVHMNQEASTSSPVPTHRASRSEKGDPLPSIYHTLLSLYLKPLPPYKPNWPPALQLLSRHGSRLPASSTLDLIPEKLPVAELESYFRGRIRAANSIVNESRVVAGLRKSEVVRAQATLLLGDGLPNGQGGRNRRVVVSDERVCGVCHKRLGGSVIAVLPDSSVVHYGCLGRANVQRPSSSRGSWGGR
ncbi:315887b3-c3cc-4346-a3d6-d2c274557d9a [Sclerotinia trifoliorum]|uniref:315887b3-c3cc-4346-a3d6-d2c274557d9a n=1 Tax=Sclerotinia trifoliorum TaxID=28548 RepID=A0A8H2W3L4_9HELO|nr:315887b3-c3cc-4346-a3d6-d2c274557d9a [Sclerotinia trifoliorum]